MMIFGIVNLIYAVHNKEQAKDYRSEKLAIKKQSVKAQSSNKNTELKNKAKITKKVSTKNSKKSAK